MLVFSLHILICFMVLGTTMFPAEIVESKTRTQDNILGISGLSGILLVGTGIYIGGGESLHAYLYITFILQLIILALFLLIYRLFKKVGYSKLITICSICLFIISHVSFVYYIIASFIYY